MSRDVLHSLADDARKGTIIVGNSANGDRARFDCHAVDDIAAGVTLLNTLGYGELLVKAGTYTPAGVIDIPADHVTITFEEGVIIERPDTAPLFTVGAGRTNVRFIGPAILDGAAKDGSHALIDIDGATYIHINGLLFVDNTNESGVYIVGDNENFTADVLIKDCFFSACKRGVWAYNNGTGETTLRRVRVDHCTFENTTSEGFLCNGIGYSSVHSCYFYGCGVTDSMPAIHIDDYATEEVTSVFVLVRGCWVDTTGASGILVEDSNACTVGDCVVISAASHGVEVKNADNNIVRNIHATNNTTDGVNIDANSDRTIVEGSQLLGNGGTPLVDNGSNTVSGLNVVA